VLEEVTMTVTVTLQLDDAIWRRASHLAQQQDQAVADVLVEWLAETLPAPANGEAASANAGADDVVTREMQAYIALHPQIKAQYRGSYVAILDGKLVDHDADYAALFDRIDARYPDTFVWLTRVEDEPIKTVVFRSPRMESPTESL
jgi:predicted transcriptional regulator